MNPVLYFIPDKNQIEPGQFDELGLSHAIDSGQCSARQVMRFAEGQSGVIVANAEAKQELIGYFPDKQTWEKRNDGPGWMGFVNDAKPGPNDLARKKMLDGHEVELADGKKWMVPLARALKDEDGELRFFNNLPSVCKRDSNGDWRAGSVVDAFSWIWPIACDWFDKRMGTAVEDGKQRFDFNDAHNDAARILGVNYRVGPDECSLLNLMSTGKAAAILDATADFRTAMEWMEKKMLERLSLAEDGISTSDG